ncbi:MAG: response regulator [Oligoflexia bacterium]|nr:response regulator [Oligoflexia bacterium]
MKVLYVDDDIEMRDYVSMILESGLDCEIFEASSGNEALAVLEMFGEEVDFVLSEVEMKMGNGDVIIDYLDQNKMDVPVVWLADSKFRDSMTVKESLSRNSVNSFIPKPFKDDQFFPVIDKIINYQGQAEVKSLASQSDEDKVDFDDSDWEGLDVFDSLSNVANEYGVEASGNQFDIKERKEEVADWSLGNKKKNAEAVEADWNLNKDQNETQADWSLKNNSNAKPDEQADWGFESNSSEQEADWSIKAKGGEGEEYSVEKNKKESEWEVLKKKEEALTEIRKIKLENSDDPEDKKKLEELNKKPIDQQDYDREKYRRFKLKRLLNFSEVCCDVFIRMNTSKYLTIINRNDNYDGTLVERYTDKGIKYLFVLKQDYERFEEMFGHLIFDKLDLIQKKDVSMTVRNVAELAAFEHTLDFAKEFGVTTLTANKVKKAVQSNLKTLKKLPNIEEIIKNIMRGGSFVSEHSLLLSYVAGQICMATSWSSPATLEKLSMAAMLHDCFFTDEELCKLHDQGEVVKNDLSPEDYAMIMDHPGEAAKIISSGEAIFPDVDTIVLQHHERPDQSGYPRGLGALSISPLSCIFIIAEDYVHQIIGKKSDEINMELIKAEFNNKYNRGNFKKVIGAFTKVF